MANEKRLIYLEDAKEALTGWETDPTDEEIEFTLDNLPTVDAVEVVHAKWENVHNGKGCCSNCHRLDGIDNLATHCRYCGAKMDGGNEE